MHAAIDPQTLFDGHAAFLQAIDFFHQGCQVHNHTTTNHVDLVGVQNAARNQVQHVFVLPHPNGVTSVITAGEAHDDVGIGSKAIDDFSFSFVSPLETDDSGGWHVSEGVRECAGGGCAGRRRGDCPLTAQDGKCKPPLPENLAEVAKD